MKIAVLLCGRDDLLYKTADRLKSLFSNDEHQYDFFCHLWEDEFSNLSQCETLTDIKSNIVNRDFNRNINRLDPTVVSKTSVNEIIDLIKLYAEDPYYSALKLTRDNLLTYINYLAPQVSTYRASKCLEKHVIETGTHYDLVIRWRYDLLSDDKIIYDFSWDDGEILPNALYVNGVGDYTMDDTFYYAPYTFFQYLVQSSLNSYSKRIMDTFFHTSEHGDAGIRFKISRGGYTWFLNRILKDSYEELGEFIRWRIRPLKTGIMREKTNPALPVHKLVHYNERLYNKDVGWEKRVLKDTHLEHHRFILTAGCSHVFGDGLPDFVNPLSPPSAYAWPQLIKKELGCTVYNISKSGAGLANIVNDIRKLPNISKVSAIMLILPHSGRFSYKHPYAPERVVDSFVASKLLRYNQEKADAVVNYIEHLQCDELDWMNYIGYVSYIAAYAKREAIDLFVVAGTQTDHERLVKENIVTLNLHCSWYDYYTSRNFVPKSCGHFGEDAHQDFYNTIVKPWLETTVFPREKEYY